MPRPFGDGLSEIRASVSFEALPVPPQSYNPGTKAGEAPPQREQVLRPSKSPKLSYSTIENSGSQYMKSLA
jgi:hypothetical protein